MNYVGREPLERAIGDLLLIADLACGPHELAARLDTLGAAVRDAGLVAEVHRMHAVRSAIPNPVGGIEMTVALALLDAAVNEQHLLADLLTRLHADHHDLLPGVADKDVTGSNLERLLPGNVGTVKCRLVERPPPK